MRNERYYPKVGRQPFGTDPKLFDYKRNATDYEKRHGGPDPYPDGPKKPRPNDSGAVAAEIPKAKEKSRTITKSEPRYRTSAR